MKTAIIFGGAGYIGLKLSEFLLKHKLTDSTVLVDIREPNRELIPGETFLIGDVRKPLLEQFADKEGTDGLGNPINLNSPIDLDSSTSLLATQKEITTSKASIVNPIHSLEPSAWIFNFAAVHREPGHAFEEYFDTNLPGAENVCNFARETGCNNLFFTASIATYGPTKIETREDTEKYPSTGYGISKLIAEKIHETWQAEDKINRKLVICRPGVVYGPGDPGNILRMIKAIQKGFFFFPGKLDIYKSYAYIYGMLDSIRFTMDHKDNVIRYNYVENPTEPLIDLADHIKSFLNKKSPILAVPKQLLLPVAHFIQLLTGGRSPIHPRRVEKAGTPTHIIPQWLIDNGFKFDYNFLKSLEHWKTISPEDFKLR